MTDVAWVAAGEGTNNLMSSENGTSWTPKSLAAGPFSNRGCAVCWNGSRWVAVGIGANNIAYSSDGLNWTGIAASTARFDSIARGVAWNGSQWVAVGGNAAPSGASYGVCYSGDGTSWTGASATFGNWGVGWGVAWNGTKWVAVGTGDYVIISSTDGITWTDRIAKDSTTFSGTCRGIAWNGSVWVAVGTGTHVIMHSTDGVSWTAANSLGNLTSGWGVCWDATYSRFVAVGAAGESADGAAYSADGVDWTSMGSPLASHSAGHAVSTDGPRIVVVGGSDNSVSTSTDGGATWSRTATGSGTFTYAGHGIASRPSGAFVGSSWTDTDVGMDASGSISLAGSADILGFIPVVGMDADGGISIAGSASLLLKSFAFLEADGTISLDEGYADLAPWEPMAAVGTIALCGEAWLSDALHGEDTLAAIGTIEIRAAAVRLSTGESLPPTDDDGWTAPDATIPDLRGLVVRAGGLAINRAQITDLVIDLDIEGGPKSATLSVNSALTRAPRIARDRLLVTYKSHTLFRGRLENIASNINSSTGYSLTYAGPLVTLRDHKGYRTVFVDSDLQSWSTDQGPRTSPDTFEVASRSSGATV